MWYGIYYVYRDSKMWEKNEVEFWDGMKRFWERRDGYYVIILCVWSEENVGIYRVKDEESWWIKII